MRLYFVRDVCMESTGIYWLPISCLLEKEFTLHLVNLRFLKQLPGRKSNVKDAKWIATVLIKGLVTDSFVSDGNIQRLRQCGRRIAFTRATNIWFVANNAIDMLLQRCNIRLSNSVKEIDCFHLN